MSINTCHQSAQSRSNDSGGRRRRARRLFEDGSDRDSEEKLKMDDVVRAQRGLESGDVDFDPRSGVHVPKDKGTIVTVRLPSLSPCCRTPSYKHGRLWPIFRTRNVTYRAASQCLKV